MSCNNLCVIRITHILTQHYFCIFGSYFGRRDNEMSSRELKIHYFLLLPYTVFENHTKKVSYFNVCKFKIFFFFGILVLKYKNGMISFFVNETFLIEFQPLCLLCYYCLLVVCVYSDAWCVCFTHHLSMTLTFACWAAASWKSQCSGRTKIYLQAQ